MRPNQGFIGHKCFLSGRNSTISRSLLSSLMLYERYGSGGGYPIIVVYLVDWSCRFAPRYVKVCFLYVFAFDCAEPLGGFSNDFGFAIGSKYFTFITVIIQFEVLGKRNRTYMLSLLIPQNNK